MPCGFAARVSAIIRGRSSIARRQVAAGSSQGDGEEARSSDAFHAQFKRTLTELGNHAQSNRARGQTAGSFAPELWSAHPVTLAR